MIELTDAAKQLVVEGGYEPIYGARPLKRYLQKNVETEAAKLILAGDVGRGDTILIDTDRFIRELKQTPSLLGLAPENKMASSIT